MEDYSTTHMQPCFSCHQVIIPIVYETIEKINIEKLIKELIDRKLKELEMEKNEDPKHDIKIV